LPIRAFDSEANDMTDPEKFHEDPVFGTDIAASPLPLGLTATTPLPDEEVVPTGGEVSSSGRMASQIFHVFVENKLAVVGVAIIVFLVLFCFIGPHIYHTDQLNQEAVLNNPSDAPPSAKYPLGTDGTGFDILGRLMYGGQTSLFIGFASALVATFVGVVFGAISGFFGGWVDALMMRAVDVLLSIPTLFLLIALVTIFHASELLIILVIAFVSWLVPARLIRGETLSLRVREYVQAVKVMGGGRTRIIGRHIIPNSVGTIVVFATFQIADSILLLASLGFLGFGVPAPGTDWGSMLSSGVDAAGNGWWWQIYPAGVAIIIVVVAFNFVGDALRDSLEVRLQKR
jgi:peptide/nickel transport system permease protein